MPEQAIRWAAARSSFQELGSAPGSASPQPPIQGLHPREGKWGGKLGPGSGTRSAAPRRLLPLPGAARCCAVGLRGAGQPGGGAATRPARCRPSMPSAASAAGSPGQRGQSCLERAWGFGEGCGGGWVRGEGSGMGGEQGRVHTPPHPGGLTPNGIPTMSFLVMGWCLSELQRAPGSGVAFALIVHFRA